MMNIIRRCLPAAILVMVLASRGVQASITAGTNFMTGRDAVNWVDAALGSSAIPRSFVSSQVVGIDFPWTAGALAFGMFYGRTSFDSGFAGPVTAQSMGVSCQRTVIGQASFGIQTGDGIVNGPGMNNVAVVMFKFYTRVPLFGFPGVFLVIAHQVIVAEKGSTANNVFHSNEVGVSVGGGPK